MEHSTGSKAGSTKGHETVLWSKGGVGEIALARLEGTDRNGPREVGAMHTYRTGACEVCLF